MSDLIENVSDNNFANAVLEANQPVLVDFWAPWCGPCRSFAPIVDELAEKYAGRARIVKINVDDNPAVVERYHVKAIPTLVLFRDGAEQQRLVGVLGHEIIAHAIDAQL